MLAPGSAAARGADSSAHMPGMRGPDQQPRVVQCWPEIRCLHSALTSRNSSEVLDLNLGNASSTSGRLRGKGLSASCVYSTLRDQRLQVTVCLPLCTLGLKLLQFTSFTGATLRVDTHDMSLEHYNCFASAQASTRLRRSWCATLVLKPTPELVLCALKSPPLPLYRGYQE